MNLKQLLPLCALVGQATAGQPAGPVEPGPNTPAATALEAAPVLAAPACDTPQHHQFDFWLGDWRRYSTRRPTSWWPSIGWRSTRKDASSNRT